MLGDSLQRLPADETLNDAAGHTALAASLRTSQMPRSIMPLLITAAIILAVIWGYNYFSEGGVAKLGRNASGGPGNKSATP